MATDAEIEDWMRKKPRHTCGGILCYCGVCHYCEDTDGEPFPGHDEKEEIK